MNARVAEDAFEEEERRARHLTTAMRAAAQKFSTAHHD
jgi:hypothetical protein